MKSVTILALDNVISSSVLGTMDIFCQAGLTWNYINGIDPVPFFNVKVVTQDGKPVKGLNNILIHPHGSAYDITSTDLIIIDQVDATRAIERDDLLEGAIDTFYVEY